MSFCFEHIGMHYQKGEFIPPGFGSGVYKAYCEVVEESESEAEDTSSEEQKEESYSDSDSDSSTDTW